VTVYDLHVFGSCPRPTEKPLCYFAGVTASTSSRERGAGSRKAASKEQRGKGGGNCGMRNADFLTADL